MKKHQNRRNPKMSEPQSREVPNSRPSQQTPSDRNSGPIQNGDPVPLSLTRDANVQPESQSTEFRLLGFGLPELNSRNGIFICKATSLIHVALKF